MFMGLMNEQIIIFIHIVIFTAGLSLKHITDTH